MNLADTAKALAIATTVYPKFEVTEDSVRVWQSLFPDPSLEEFSAALRMHIKTSKFIPTPADIETLLQTDKTLYFPDVSQAWREVRREIGRVGLEGKPAFSHPVIKHVVDSMGWRSLCDMTKPEVTLSQFMKLYNSATCTPARLLELNAQSQKELNGGNNTVKALAENIKSMDDA